MNKKILITGASGFTGAHFIQLANKLGYQCIALCHKNSDVVSGCAAVVIANLANKAELKIQIGKVRPDYVWHLATISFVGHGEVAEIYRTNVIGTINLLDSLIELGCP